MAICPCGSHKTFEECCQPFIAEIKLPQTPEELMRSRYTAYTKANIPYIVKTMKSPAADGFNPKEAKRWAENVVWLKLEVLSSSANGTQGFVEFKAHYYQKNKKHVLHEKSEFQFVDGRWYYVAAMD